jgi:hypothetical protein
MAKVQVMVTENIKKLTSLSGQMKFVGSLWSGASWK